ncbi:MAG: DUF6516 family protein [Candidatus Brocadiaceae bacterium]|nr:DUF6516 family protein [Candidatus Brocadiaceae bacterium]
MYAIVSTLKESHLFPSVDIIDLVDEESVKLIRIKARVLDGTILYITELYAKRYQKYSYHWRKENGELIIRWDNKPHWKNLKTFPYHKHEEGKVFPSHRVIIDDVVTIIKERVK